MIANLLASQSFILINQQMIHSMELPINEEEEAIGEDRIAWMHGDAFNKIPKKVNES